MVLSGIWLNCQWITTVYSVGRRHTVYHVKSNREILIWTTLWLLVQWCYVDFSIFRVIISDILLALRAFQENSKWKVQPSLLICFWFQVITVYLQYDFFMRKSRRLGHMVFFSVKICWNFAKTIKYSDSNFVVQFYTPLKFTASTRPLRSKKVQRFYQYCAFWNVRNKTKTSLI